MQEYLESFFENVDACQRFVTRLKEARRATPDFGCIGHLEKESQDRWVFTLSLGEGKFVADALSPFEPTEANVVTFNRGVADLAGRLRIYEETGDADQIPQQPSPFAELTHPDGLAPEWEEVHRFGESRTYVDRAGIIVRASGVLAWVRYRLQPPGHDKVNNKPVAEMWNCEEFDVIAKTTRVHRIVFKYVDGSQGEPVRPSHEWKPVRGGSERTLEYLQAVVGRLSNSATEAAAASADGGSAAGGTELSVDPGLECLRVMHARPMIDEPWTERRPRGFSWIGHRLKQAVDASPVFDSKGVMVSQITFRTTVVRDVQVSTEDVYEVLAKLNRYSIASAYVYFEEQRLIVSTGLAYVHEGTLDWRPAQLASFATIQLCIAESEADYLAEMTKGRVAVDAHAISGVRQEPDEILGSLDSLFAVHGRQPSRFANKFEFDAMVDVARQGNAATLGATADGVCFEFPYADYTSLLRLSVNIPHRRAGSGLLVELFLPTHRRQENAVEIAALLNRREAEGESVAGFCGAWSVGPPPTGNGDVVTYREFIPNLMHLPGLTQGELYKGGGRARWANALLNPGAPDNDAWEIVLKRHADVLAHATPNEATDDGDMVTGRDSHTKTTMN